MDSATIERLIIDRQMNELTPDAQALLDVFLSEHPEHQSLADDVQRTLRLAERALVSDRPPLPVEMPAFPEARMSAVSLRPRRWSSRLRPLAAAAVLLLAFWTGSRFGPGTMETLDRHAQQLARGESNPDEGGFWSLRRAHRGTVATSPRDRGLNWTSPTQWPQIGDKS